MTVTPKKSLEDRLSALAKEHSSRPKLPPGHPLDSKWEKLLIQEPKKLFNPDGSIKFDYLTEFRRREIFVSDMAPTSDFTNLDPRLWWKSLLANPLKGIGNLLCERLLGSRKGIRQLLKDTFQVLEAEHALDLLGRHPAAGTPGAPFTYSIKGYSFNLRWARHIYFHNLLQKHLGGEIRKRKRFISMDIGSSYGIFSSIFTAEYPNSTQVLVDFPDQHLLAYYYIAKTFPEARIGTLSDLLTQQTITREFLEQFDFVLAPVATYEMFAANSVDMVTNFFSFGEMRREWFMGYIQGKAFQTAEFFFTSNRIESAPRLEPTYDSDLTILDYPLADYQRLLFGVFPLYTYHIRKKFFLDYEKLPFSSQNFDFIGRKHSNSEAAI